MKGFAAITTILIIVSISLLLGLTISYLSIGELIIGLGRHSSSQSLYLANLCAEQALMDLKENAEYVGDVIEVEDGACVITVIPIMENEGVWEMRIVSDFKKQVKKIKISISQVHPEIIIESWQQVADF